MTGTKHSPAEIAAKLRQANELASQGKRRSEILRAIGISAMTYHRWRKDRSIASHPLPEPRAPLVASDASAAAAPAKIDAVSFATLSARDQISAFQELQRENVRLRELFTDALLDKIRLEEEFRAFRAASAIRGSTVA